MWSENIHNNIVCEYSNLMLFEKHLKTMNGNHGGLRRRLQARMLNTLKRLAHLYSSGNESPDSEQQIT